MKVLVVLQEFNNSNKFFSSRKGLFKNRCGLHICVYQKSHFLSTVALSHLKGPPIFSCQVPAINVYRYHTSKSFILHLTQILFSLFSDEEGYNHWQELLKFLFECCNSQHSELKECALHIFV